VRGLQTQFAVRGGVVKAVDGVDFRVKRGEIVGIVGESGSGKSMTALSVLRLVPEPGKVVGGDITFNGRDVLEMDREELRNFRGSDVAMIFQDPMSSLNPVLRVGAQVQEAMTAHDRFNRSQAKARVPTLFKRLLVADAEKRSSAFPFQFSGGMRQRVMIAMALANEPALLIADEPTTSLDVTVQAQILEQLREVNHQLGTAIVLITHNIGVVASLCEWVVVMYAGRVVEQGPVDEVFRRPQHPYTWALFHAFPRIEGSRGERLRAIPGSPPDLGRLPTGCKFAPRCPFSVARCTEAEPDLATVGQSHQSRCWVQMSSVPASVLAEDRTAVSGAGGTPLAVRHREETVGTGLGRESSSVLVSVRDVHKHFQAGRGTVHAVDGISLDILRGETLGIVGETGSGKSTFGRIVAQLQPLTKGEVWFEGVDLGRLRGEALRQVRRHVQMIFQDPYSSLNPRMTVGSIVGEPLQNFHLGSSSERLETVREVLHASGLDSNYINRYPHEFSGGERQRIAIARALVLRPSFIVADEPVSALDVSMQAQIINLLEDLQQQLQLTYLFIGHDLSVIRHISDRVGVMYLGSIVELAQSDDLYAGPLHPYTTALLQAVPVADPVVQRGRSPIILRGEIPSLIEPPSGCRFHTRCPIAEPICSEVRPPLSPYGGGHWAACHFAGKLQGSLAEKVAGATVEEVRSALRGEVPQQDGSVGSVGG
jgi:peptide/nickel transport system ATP-binding protein